MRRRISSLLLAALLLTSLLPAAYAEESPFGDVPGSHWASQFIRRAAGEGWVSGTGGSSYGPSETLTNAQFLTMVSNTFFADEVSAAETPAGAPWYAKFWTLAQEHGLSEGTSIQGQGDLGNQINRYDMAQIIVNAMAVQNVEADEEDTQKAQEAIADWSGVPQNYRSAVSAAYALGILSGKTGGNFAGSDCMTRAEAAAVLCHMVDAILGAGTQPSQPEQPEVPEEPEQPEQPEVPEEPQKPEQPETPEQPEVPEEPQKPEQPEQPEVPQQPQQPDQSQPTADDLTAEVVRLVNVERAKQGLKPLATFDSLTQAAQIRAEEIITLYEHTRPDGRRCFTALDETGASKNAWTMGENIYASPTTPAEAVEGWMNSEGHRANILNPNFTHIGVGYAAGGEWGHYWVQMFIGMR